MIYVHTFKIDQTWLFVTIYYQWNDQCSANGTPPLYVFYTFL